MFNQISQTFYTIYYRYKFGAATLHKAARIGQTDCLNALIQAGANIHETNEQSETALHYAARHGQIDCLNALIQAGANIHATNRWSGTALHYAARRGQIDCLNALIQAGANIDATNEWGDTALHAAAQSGNTHCINTLIQAGANIDATNQQGSTALLRAAACGQTACLNVLIQAGANIDTAKENGNTALHETALCGNTECLHELIQAGANIDTTNRWGQTPIAVAFENGQHEIVRILQQHGPELPEHLQDDQQVPQINGNQSTHQTSVHESVAQSASTLYEYYKQNSNDETKTIFDTARSEFEQWLSQQTHKTFAEPAKRAFERLKNSEFIEGRSNVPMKDTLAFIWLGANDTSEAIPVQTRQEALLESLYRIQRGYNINAQDKDNGETDSPICASGAFNELINALGEGRHSKVQIIMLSNETVTAKANALTVQIVTDIFNQHTKKEQIALAKEWECPFPDNFKEQHLKTMQDRLTALLNESFNEHKNSLYGFDAHVKGICDNMESMHIKTIDAVSNILHELEKPSKRAKNAQNNPGAGAPITPLAQRDAPAHNTRAQTQAAQPDGPAQNTRSRKRKLGS